MRGVILEGIPGTGKSQIYRLLVGETAQKNLSLFALSENCTERMLEPLRQASLAESLSILDRIIFVLEGYAQLPCLNVSGKNKFFLLERFHFSHCLDIAGMEYWNRYSGIEDKLKSFDAVVIVLTIAPEDIPERTLRQTRKVRPASWSSYLNTLGKTDTEIAGYYRQQQEQLVALSRRSLLPCHFVDTTKQNWTETAEKISHILFTG